MDSSCEWRPGHAAAPAVCANTAAVCLLLAAAPDSASARGGTPPRFPLEEALDWAAGAVVTEHDPAPYLSTARLLLSATPADDLLAALLEAGEVALPLFADLAASSALSPVQCSASRPHAPAWGPFCTLCWDAQKPRRGSWSASCRQRSDRACAPRRWPRGVLSGPWAWSCQCRWAGGCWAWQWRALQRRRVVFTAACLRNVQELFWPLSCSVHYQAKKWLSAIR